MRLAFSSVLALASLSSSLVLAAINTHPNNTAPPPPLLNTQPGGPSFNGTVAQVMVQQTAGNSQPSPLDAGLLNLFSYKGGPVMTDLYSTGAKTKVHALWWNTGKSRQVRLNNVNLADLLPAFIDTLNASPLWEVVRLYSGTNGKVGGIQFGSTFKVDDEDLSYWNTIAPGLRGSKIDNVYRASFNYDRWKLVLAKIVSSNYLPNEPNDSIYVLFMDSQTDFAPWVIDGQSKATCAFHSYVNGLSGTGINLINPKDTYFYAVLGYVDENSVCYRIADGAMKWRHFNPTRNPAKYVKSVTYLNTLAHELMEIMTDPLLGSGIDANGKLVDMGWYAIKDDNGISENADFCVMQYSGTPQTTINVDDNGTGCKIYSNFNFEGPSPTKNKLMRHYVAIQDALHPGSKKCVRSDPEMTNIVIKSRAGPNFCLDQWSSSAQWESSGSVTLTECRGWHNQRWTYNPQDQTLKVNSNCLNVPSGIVVAGQTIRHSACNSSSGNQKWIYSYVDKTIRWAGNLSLCLDVSGGEGAEVQLQNCVPNNNQKWDFTDGPCGNGNRGNGVCSNGGTCSSTGWCPSN